MDMTKFEEFKDELLQDNKPFIPLALDTPPGHFPAIESLNKCSMLYGLIPRIVIATILT
jgi:hypothetical protein